MMKSLTLGMASALALGTAAPAFAQYQPTPQYQRDYRAYQDSRESYREARQDYRQARREYERQLARWERDRRAYDARWGYGAYARSTPRPVWDDAYWSRGAQPYAYGQGYSTPYASNYGVNSAYSNIRCDNNNSTVTAGIIGAIAGAALGSNVAARNARTEGAVLGAVLGGAVGAGVGRANDRYKCDSRGPYFEQAETVPYREPVGQRYGQYASRDYDRMRCRLAPAPVDNAGSDYRYVRVCPDESGRYRITG